MTTPRLALLASLCLLGVPSLASLGVPSLALAQEDGVEPDMEAPVDVEPAFDGGEDPGMIDDAGEAAEGEERQGSSRTVTGPRGLTQAFGEQTAARSDAPNNVLLGVTLGSSLTYGNTRTVNVTSSANLQLRDGPDVGVIEVAFLYGIAQSPLTCGDVQDSDPGIFPMPVEDLCAASSRTTRAPGFASWKELAVNLQWRLRWDHFLDDENAIFVATLGRVDRFAGVLPRVALQVGWNHILFKEGRNHSFAFDLGVDGTLDVFADSSRREIQRQVDMGATLPPLWGTDARFMPQALLRLNYVNHTNAAFWYDTTLEAFWDVADFTHLRGQWVNHFRSVIDRMFQMRLDITGRFDSRPPGQAVAFEEDPNTQTVTMFELLATLSLQGTFDLDGEAAAEEGEGRRDREGGGGGGRGGGGGGGARCAAGASCLRTTPARGGGGGGGGGRGGGGGGGGSREGREGGGAGEAGEEEAGEGDGSLDEGGAEEPLEDE